MTNPMRLALDHLNKVRPSGIHVERAAKELEVGLEDYERLRRQSYLAYLYLNIVQCPKCHLPSAQGLVCPCGYDGDPETLDEKVQREFR